MRSGVEAGAIEDKKQGVSEAPISWARGDFFAFYERKDVVYAEKSSLSEGLNRGLMRGFRAELGGDDDGKERWAYNEDRRRL